MYSFDLPTSPLSLGALSLKGDIPPNGLDTLLLHFTCFVTWQAQDWIRGTASLGVHTVKIAARIAIYDTNMFNRILLMGFNVGL